MKKSILSALTLSLFLFSCSKNITLEDLTGPEALHDRSVGASAKELLSASKYKALQIEVQYMPGFAPDAAALDHLKTFLANYLNKPSGISITTKEIAAASSTTLSTSDIISLERANRSVFSLGETVSVYLMYTNGGFTDSKVLGAAYRNTSAVIFGQKIRENSGGIGQPSRTKLEATVLEHELGHLLGLVDNGTPMQNAHKDADHGSHCNQQSCLMYYAAETSDVLGLLVTGNIPALDANCASDLKAGGGK